MQNAECEIQNSVEVDKLLAVSTQTAKQRLSILTNVHFAFCILRFAL